MVSGGIEVNLFVQICSLLEAQFGDDLLRKVVTCMRNKAFIRVYENNYFFINPCVKTCLRIYVNGNRGIKKFSGQQS